MLGGGNRKRPLAEFQTTLSAQIGYIVTFYVAVKKVKLMKKFTMLRVGNTTQ